MRSTEAENFEKSTGLSPSTERFNQQNLNQKDAYPQLELEESKSGLISLKCKLTTKRQIHVNVGKNAK